MIRNFSGCCCHLKRNHLTKMRKIFHYLACIGNCHHLLTCWISSKSHILGGPNHRLDIFDPFPNPFPPPLVCAFWVCCTVELISLAKHLKNGRIRCFSALLKRLKTLNLEPPKGWISSTVTRFPFSLQNLTKIKAWYSIFNHSFYTATLRNVP